MSNRYLVYTDGACANNQAKGGQPGGWAAVFVDGPELSGGEWETTNNRMELRAAIEALQYTPEGSEVTIFTDSAYLMNAFVQGWIENWEKRGWLNSQNRPVENQDLWKRLRALEQKRKVVWQKVKGHSGNQWNERADRLAVQAIPKYREDQQARSQEKRETAFTLREVQELYQYLSAQPDIPSSLQPVVEKLSRMAGKGKQAR